MKIMIIMFSLELMYTLCLLGCQVIRSDGNVEPG